MDQEIKNYDLSKIIFGIVMLHNEHPLNVNNFLKDYNKNYKEKIEDLNIDGLTVTFTVAGNGVAIIHEQTPVPKSDIEGTAQYAYNWPDAAIETASHKTHLNVSIINEGSGQVMCFKIFTRIISSLLRTTNAPGVYMGLQSLLISRDEYLQTASKMDDENLPLSLWLYFGLRKWGDRTSGYTYGLHLFNKTEIEILDSAKPLTEIIECLFAVSNYLLTTDRSFETGESIDFSEDETITISLSSGEYVEGNSFKLAF
ncbi:DUF4261 domain-containing protein [Chitinophagaceae bacterium LWZ2-11]